MLEGRYSKIVDRMTTLAVPIKLPSMRATLMTVTAFAKRNPLEPVLRVATATGDSKMGSLQRKLGSVMVEQARLSSDFPRIVRVALTAVSAQSRTVRVRVAVRAP